LPLRAWKLAPLLVLLFELGDEEGY